MIDVEKSDRLNRHFFYTWILQDRPSSICQLSLSGPVDDFWGQAALGVYSRRGT